MTLISCYECSKEISDSAPSCPHCGAPKKNDQPASAPLKIHPIGHGDDRLEKGFLGVLLKLVGFILIAFLIFSWLDGNDSSSKPSESVTVSPPASNGRPLPEELNHFTAQQLNDAYEANTVAADQRFKNKWLVVEGVVRETSTDLFGDAYVSLDVKDQFNRPRVKFIKSEENKLAQLTNGQKISAVCIGDGDIMKTPMLKNCTLIE